MRYNSYTLLTKSRFGSCAPLQIVDLFFFFFFFFFFTTILQFFLQILTEKIERAEDSRIFFFGVSNMNFFSIIIEVLRLIWNFVQERKPTIPNSLHVSFYLLLSFRCELSKFGQICSIVCIWIKGGLIYIEFSSQDQLQPITWLEVDNFLESKFDDYL